MISNGRNRMEITIFKRRDVEAVKMYGFPGYFDTEIIEPIYEVTVQMYTIQSAIPSRKKVHIGNDTWLEALKFLSFPQWSKALFVSRQLAGVVQGNISCLPRIIVDSATMSEVEWIEEISSGPGNSNRLSSSLFTSCCAHSFPSLERQQRLRAAGKQQEIVAGDSRLLENFDKPSMKPSFAFIEFPHHVGQFKNWPNGRKESYGIFNRIFNTLFAV
ncbi:hypothetical protein DdX_22320 [Ditylenchus destructor]|uniref:Uncharacterized protein n=1 Tax=Ditylenchus destructor TaxID=166010 RepID=A0AAD4ME88_9BILA|nr:hypothetical protein DdX_22320 [Ditylenchus destructor]